MSSPMSTVLVTDMKSFTALTRKLGILHVGAAIMKMRALLLPRLRQYHGQATAEADNCRAVFERPLDALRAAFEVRNALEDYNRDKEPDDCILLGGIGLDTGSDVVTHGDELVGTVVDLAFYLSEDIAVAGEILVSEDLRDAIRDAPEFRELEFDFRPWDPDQTDAAVVHGKGYYLVRGAPERAAPPLALRPVKYENPGEADFDELCEARLTSTGLDRERVDHRIRERYVRNATALIFSYRHEDRTQFEVRQKIREVIASAMQDFGGRFSHEESSLIFFHTPFDGLAAALEVAAELARRGLHLRGMGIDHGEVLAIDGTVVSWGDPVNTAGKLGEDLARNGEILLSERARELVERYLRMVGDCRFAAAETRLSGVKLMHCHVERSRDTQ